MAGELHFTSPARIARHAYKMQGAKRFAADLRSQIPRPALDRTRYPPGGFIRGQNLGMQNPPSHTHLHLRAVYTVRPERETAAL